MSWICEKTHCCKGSLEAGVSVIYNANSFRYAESGIVSGWSLWNKELDLEYADYYDSLVSKIMYCPYCGIKLEA